VGSNPTFGIMMISQTGPRSFWDLSSPVSVSERADMATRVKRSGIISFTQFVAIIVAIVALSLVIDFGRKAAINYRIQREVDRLEQEVAAARQEQQRLLTLKAYVQTDEYVEKAAREELRWARLGEAVIIVRPIARQAPPPAQEAILSTEPAGAKSYWREWWALFFDSSPADFMALFEFLD
jgi:cell division protein FtsB